MPDRIVTPNPGNLNNITDDRVRQEIRKLWEHVHQRTGQLGNPDDRFITKAEYDALARRIVNTPERNQGYRATTLGGDDAGGGGGGGGGGGALGAIYFGVDPPAVPTDWLAWWNTEEGALKIYYKIVDGDPDSSQWVDAMPARQGQVGPAGSNGTNGANGTSGGTAAECCGRLTVVSGTAVPSTDQTAKSTLYWTPYNGATMAMYSGGTWTIRTYSEVSLALSGLTTDKNYDVWGNDSGGTLVLTLSAAWASDTARTDAIALQDGVVVKSGDATKRYLGTIRTTGTSTTEDSAAKRYVFNQYNRVRRHMANPTEGTNSWGYTTGSFRQANANTANQLDYVDGEGSVEIDAHCMALFGSSASGYVTVGIGIDSTTTNSAQIFGGWCSSAIAAWPRADYCGTPGVGRHYVAWLEKGQGVAGGSFYGDNGATYAQSGIIGSALM